MSIPGWLGRLATDDIHADTKRLKAAKVELVEDPKDVDNVPRAMAMSSDRELAAFVCSHIFDNTRPVLLVARENRDWMFLCGAEHPADEEYHVVGIDHLFTRDPTLTELTDLENDWEAERTSTGGAWRRSKITVE
jgi:hypothetical protein